MTLRAPPRAGLTRAARNWNRERASSCMPLHKELGLHPSHLPLH